MGKGACLCLVIGCFVLDRDLHCPRLKVQGCSARIFYFNVLCLCRYKHHGIMQWELDFAQGLECTDIELSTTLHMGSLKSPAVERDSAKGRPHIHYDWPIIHAYFRPCRFCHCM